MVIFSSLLMCGMSDIITSAGEGAGVSPVLGGEYDSHTHTHTKHTKHTKHTLSTHTHTKHTLSTHTDSALPT